MEEVTVHNTGIIITMIKSIKEEEGEEEEEEEEGSVHSVIFRLTTKQQQNRRPTKINGKYTKYTKYCLHSDVTQERVPIESF